MFIVCLMFSLFILAGIIALVYIVAMFNKHKYRTETLRTRFYNQNFRSDDEKTAFSYYLEREQNYIQNYILFQITGKLCEMLSIIYSVSSLLLTYVEEDRWLVDIGKIAIPIMSVILIIVVIYVVPSRRWAEYLQAWRDMDYYNNLVLEDQIDICEIPAKLKRIESRITSDKV